MKNKMYKVYKEDKSKFFDYLYKQEFPQIRAYILSNGGTIEDAEDIFQEVMLIILKKLDEKKIEFVTLSGLILKIAKNLWLQTFRKEKTYTLKNKRKLSSDIACESDINFNEQQNEINQKIILKHIKRLDIDNRKLFLLYYNRYKASVIAELMGYSGGENYVRKKLHICKSRLIQNIKNDPEFLGL